MRGGHGGLVRRLRPMLTELARDSGMSAVRSTPTPTEPVAVDQVDPPGRREPNMVGWMLPLHATTAASCDSRSSMSPSAMWSSARPCRALPTPPSPVGTRCYTSLTRSSKPGSRLTATGLRHEDVAWERRIEPAGFIALRVSRLSALPGPSTSPSNAPRWLESSHVLDSRATRAQDPLRRPNHRLTTSTSPASHREDHAASLDAPQQRDLTGYTRRRVVIRVLTHGVLGVGTRIGGCRRASRGGLDSEARGGFQRP